MAIIALDQLVKPFLLNVCYQRKKHKKHKTLNTSEGCFRLAEEH